MSLVVSKNNKALSIILEAHRLQASQSAFNVLSSVYRTGS